jgi:hypothetical protein
LDQHCTLLEKGKNVNANIFTGKKYQPQITYYVETGKGETGSYGIRLLWLG